MFTTPGSSTHFRNLFPGFMSVLIFIFFACYNPSLKKTFFLNKSLYNSQKINLVLNSLVLSTDIHSSIEEEKSFSSEVIDFFKDLIIIVVVVKFITVFLVSIFIINGQSMYASYYDKEFILVDRFSALEIGNFKSQSVQRWDVVVFKPGVSKTKEYFIKRIVWMPGDEIKITEWQVYLKKGWEGEFQLLDEQYLNEDNYWNTKVDGGKKVNTYLVPEEKYYVMWDNRGHSSDSRTCFSYSCNSTSRDNFIGKEYVVWKVLLDFGYFNFKDFAFSHPEIDDENGNPIITKPRWTKSPDSYTY